VNYYYLTLQIIVTAYAFIAGGGPERVGAAGYAVAVAATHLILETHVGRWKSVEYGVFLVDVLLFIFFAILTVRANRFWPIWVSALLGLGVLGHLARWAGPHVIWWAYAVILSIWSYPILLIIALGTWNHRRRLVRNGADISWSISFARSAPQPRSGPTA
jgi:hypothetical protein